MKIINLLLGIRLLYLLKLLGRNGITLKPIYLLRFLVLFQNSILSSIFTLVEKIKYGEIISQTNIEKDPIFIIGHWRTGSTYLHQLLNLDNQFTTPTVIQNAIPDHFIFSTKYYLPVMKAFMPKKRPMDEVKMAPLEPHEDEFALIRMGSVSPLEKLVFPPKDKYFLSEYHEYIPSRGKLEKWENNLTTFIKKIQYPTKKQVVLKNPFHTMRLTLLLKMFPQAKFIHIYRHPYDIVLSTIRMWNIVADENALKNTWKKPTVVEACQVLDEYWSNIEKEKKNFGVHHFCEVKFEDLEKDPVSALQRIYTALNLDFTENFKDNVHNFTDSLKTYRKNSYQITAEEKELIYSCMERFFSYYKYDC